MLNIGYVVNETNTDVCMYTWRIYSSGDLDALLCRVDPIALENTLAFIQLQQRKEM